MFTDCLVPTVQALLISVLDGVVCKYIIVVVYKDSI